MRLPGSEALTVKRKSNDEFLGGELTGPRKSHFAVRSFQYWITSVSLTRNSAERASRKRRCAAEPQPNERIKARNDSPSPLNGKRAGVRGEKEVNQSAGRRRSDAPPLTSFPLPVEGRGKPGDVRSEKFASSAQTFTDSITEHTECSERRDGIPSSFSVYTETVARVSGDNLFWWWYSLEAPFRDMGEIPHIPAKSGLINFRGVYQRQQPLFFVLLPSANANILMLIIRCGSSKAISMVVHQGQPIPLSV